MNKSITQEKFDAIIIGSGQGGKPLAFAFADKGLKTALIEAKYVGGTCINYGCTPTKTMIASAKIADMARNAEKFGVKTNKLKVDMRRVVERKNEIVKAFRDSGRKNLQKNEKIELIFGQASFINEYSVRVKLNKGGIRTLSSDIIIIDTGTSPFIPNIDGMKKSGYLTSRSIMELEKVPEHLIILGGGYVGLEFAQMFRRFGSRVTIIHKNSMIISEEDEDVSHEIRKILTEDGIDIILKANTVNVTRTKKGKLVITEKSGSVETEIEGTHLLVAAGIKPNTANLNTDAAGIKTNLSGYIIVNDKLQTSTDGIYAIGDVNGGPAFTHISYDDYRILKSNLLENRNLSTKDRLVPYTIYTDPQLGRIGLNEKEVLRKGIKYKTAKYPVVYIARAVETGETRGFMKALVDSNSGLILGCSIIAPNGGEIMSMIEIAMMAKLPYTELRDAIFAHPLYSESLNSLFNSVK